MRFLDNGQVHQVLEFDAVVAAVERGFRALGTGHAAMQARVRTSAGGSKLSTLGAVVDSDGVMGAKVYATTAAGQFHFLILIFDSDTGRPLGLLEGDEITAVRTAATSLLAARHLAVPDSHVLTVFGTGVQAAAHLRAMAVTYPLEEIRIVHRRQAREFITIQQTLTETPIRQMIDPEEAVADADLVVTATRARRPLFPGTAIPAGCHVTAVGATQPGARELDDGLVARADIVAVEWREQAREEAGDLVAAAKNRAFDWERCVELADLVVGRAAGRTHRDMVTVFESVGVGIEDVVVANAALRAAQQLGVGTVLR